MYRFLLLSIGLSLLSGFSIGATVDASLFHPAPLPQVIEDRTPPPVPVVQIQGIRNGMLVGTMSGSVRLSARGRIISPQPDGTFRIADRAVLTNEIQIIIPDGMQFVASKRGKKYYPVESASAANLSPANRVYFPDAVTAERAGFRK